MPDAADVIKIKTPICKLMYYFFILSEGTINAKFSGNYFMV